MTQLPFGDLDEVESELLYQILIELSGEDLFGLVIPMTSSQGCYQVQTTIKEGM